MKKNFINFSNHNSDNWNDSQIQAAQQYGNIVDVQFPNVLPTASKNDIDRIATAYIEKIETNIPEAVMCQGEFTLCFAVVSKLKEKGIKCLAACSDRKVEEKILENGSVEKNAVFEFVGFREY